MSVAGPAKSVAGARVGPGLACPRDRLDLEWYEDEVRCGSGHTYPVVEGIPVMLLPEEKPTHPELRSDGMAEPQYLGQWPEYEGQPQGSIEAVDEFVQRIVAATNGRLYRDAVNRLPRYPIPDLRGLPERGDDRRLLDVGCNWGRWSIAASRAGYRVVGIDPSLEAVKAACRVSKELSVSPQFVAGDGRQLPFPDGSFDYVLSYGVFQHLPKDDVRRCLLELRRVLRPGGTAMIQMASARGMRNMILRARRRLRRKQLERDDFHVRYWAPRELRDAFTEAIGPTELHAENYFSMHGQPADLDLMPRRYRAVIRVSEALRGASERLPPVRYAADSLLVESRRSRSV